MKTANYQWQQILSDLTIGNSCAPRGMPVRELMSYQSVINMQHPLVTVAERRLNYRFAAAEAYWILTGDNRLAPLVQHIKKFRDFSDDGETLSGAYGPQVVDQMRYVISTLQTDNDSRQAVMTLWRPRPQPSRDIPCTVALQFLVRDGRIHCVATMRSSDAWLGWPYDVFSFTMISTMVGLKLIHGNVRFPKLELGRLYMNVGSQHVYCDNPPLQLRNICRNSVNYEEYHDMTLYGLISPDHLLQCLRYVSEYPEYKLNHSEVPTFFKEMVGLILLRKEGKKNELVTANEST